MTEALTIHFTRRTLGHGTTAELTDIVLSNKAQMKMAERHPKQSMKVAEGASASVPKIAGIPLPAPQT